MVPTRNAENRVLSPLKSFPIPVRVITMSYFKFIAADVGARVA